MRPPGPRAARAGLLVLLAAATLLPNPEAALPWRTYYFRDFTATFYPLRLFAAREMAQGRVAFWNPYLHEGTFAIPSFYPLDLVQALVPGPVSLSWLLTLHFPIAALACFWLARELGLSRLGAFGAGIVYAMGGLALSSLNLYVFLQALALAPLVVGTLRRSVSCGGRWVAWAALALGAALSTLAVEFVAQAVLLGAALGLAAGGTRRAARSAAWLLAALALGVGLAAVPVAIVQGFVPETLRGTGFARPEALRYALEPAQVLQALISGILGPPHALQSDGRMLLIFGELPYFVTLYVGPFALAAAAAGAARGELKAVNRVLLAAAVLGLWIAFGRRGGLAPLVLSLPGLEGFRYPCKALLLPHAAVALLAGSGLERLAAGRGWRAVRAAAALASALCVGVAAAAGGGTKPLAAMFGVDPALLGFFAPSAVRECLLAALLAALPLALASAVQRGVLRARVGALLFAAVLTADLARSAAFVNPQTDAGRLSLRPEVAAELGGGGRVFSYGVVSSPEFLRCATVHRRGIEAWSPWLSRQVLAPYTNVIDGLEGAATPDLTALGAGLREPTLAELRPEAVGALLPRLRDAGVGRVLSLDPLDDPGLRLRRGVPLGFEGVSVHVYEVLGPQPRDTIHCDCRQASVRRRVVSTDELSFDVSSDSPGVLVMRDTFARGWRATLDGQAVELHRSGTYRAVDLPGGSHQVVLRYRPPGLRAGLALFVAALAGTAAVLAGVLGERPVSAPR